jgi:hypothetical protein
MAFLTARRLASAMVSLLLVAGHAAAQDTAPAQKAATEWLALIDAGRYAESWTAAASTFKQAVTQEKWQEAVKTVREQAGPLKSRGLKQASPAKNPPGAPAGEYVIFQYGSSFERGDASAETVSTVLDTDGTWRVVGYFVR